MAVDWQTEVEALASWVRLLGQGARQPCWGAHTRHLAPRSYSCAFIWATRGGGQWERDRIGILVFKKS